MDLVLLRHGIATSREDPDCPPDAQRPLTAKGIRRVRLSAAGLRALGVMPGRILSSPLVRARQTAMIAAEVLGLDPGLIRETDALRPGGDPNRVLAEARRRKSGDILCVGHAPNLDRVVAGAVGVGGGRICALGKAGAACLRWVEETEPPRLVWLLPARVLRRLGQ